MGDGVFDAAFVGGNAGSWAGRLLGRLEASAPHLLSALIVIIVGGLVAVLVGKLAETLARNAAIANLRAVGRTFRGIVLCVTALVASDRLGFGASLAGIILLIAVAAVLLALAIAFGLGARSLAREAADKGLADLRSGIRAKMEPSAAETEEGESPLA
jgi:hypothetical protein